MAGINVGFCQVVQLKSLTETIVTGYTDMTNMRVNVVYKYPQVFFIEFEHSDYSFVN